LFPWETVYVFSGALFLENTWLPWSKYSLRTPKVSCILNFKAIAWPHGFRQAFACRQLKFRDFIHYSDFSSRGICLLIAGCGEPRWYKVENLVRMKSIVLTVPIRMVVSVTYITRHLWDGNPCRGGTNLMGVKNIWHIGDTLQLGNKRPLWKLWRGPLDEI